MAKEIETQRYTIDELVQLFRQGDLSVEHGEIRQLDGSSIQAVFQGRDGELYLNFSLQEDLTGRSDEEGHFNINQAEIDVDEKPIDLKDGETLEFLKAEDRIGEDVRIRRTKDSVGPDEFTGYVDEDGYVRSGDIESEVGRNAWLNSDTHELVEE